MRSKDEIETRLKFEKEKLRKAQAQRTDLWDVYMTGNRIRVLEWMLKDEFEMYY